MRRPIVLAALLAAGLGGCAAARSPTLEYLPPSGPPAAARSAVVRQQPWLAWGNIVDRLQQQAGLTISEADEVEGALVVRYHGDPEPYVDCGWILAYQRLAVERTPAAAALATFERRWQGKLVTVERGLELEARMTVQVEPDGETAVVRTDSTYGLTKSVAPQAAEQPLHSETIGFHSGESGTFSSGTVCQPTGALERLVLDALPPLSFAGS
jgi:hypothetical protein